MILTGPEIAAAQRDGRLRIDPFDLAAVNPNSYNLRLGPTLLQYNVPVLDAARPNPTREMTVGESGVVLQPGRLYLGHTIETAGSDVFVPLLFGRSSVGRLGLFVEITAPIGDIGFHGQWTLMLHPTVAVRVYAGMRISQIMFFLSKGPIDTYSGKYQHADGPRSSASWQDLVALGVGASS
ncbi:dCTP deaminase [Catenulispora sp. GAS73]|uniref:dCTP deaminase n=1 Tax=Catenulispora sp. GAS73 TaxID=3156269 RepID=UPI003511EFC6